MAHAWSGRKSAIGPPGGARREFLGVPIDCLTRAETVTAAEAAMRDKRSLRQVSINIAKFIAMRSDAELDRDVRSSDVISADGMGIVWAARLLGVMIPERVAGADLMDDLLACCAQKGYRPYFLGARRDVVREAVAAAIARHPGLDFAGWRDGYFTADDEGQIVAAIRSSQADCLFLGMPTPGKERFLARYHGGLGVPFTMGVGGSLDVLAGRVRRAPEAIRRLGLEWLFRAVQEPRRLLPRYLKTNTRFVAVLAKALLARRLSK